jgi:signal transduction histidine kinase
MIKSAPEITQEEKIKRLIKSFYTTFIIVPLVFLVIVVMYLAGLPINYVPLTFVLAINLCLAFLMYVCVEKRWLVDQIYAYLYAGVLCFIVAATIRYTGSIISPFVWGGVLIATYETIEYGTRRGTSISAFFLVFLWTNNLLELFNIIPHSGIIPGFDPYRSPPLVFILQIGYSLMFLLLPATVGVLSNMLRKEKRSAEESAEEQKKAYRMSLSIMEDLEAVRRELETRVKDVEDSRRATLHLLSDVERSREEAGKKAEEIARLYEDLKVVDRMRTEFLAVISHELRTPMTPIKGYTSMLLSGTMGALNPAQERAVGIIQKQNEHLQELIDSVLEVSRLVRGRRMELSKEPISMRVMLSDLIDAIGPQVETRDIRIETAVPDDFPTILADMTKLRRLLTNLIGNAIKFTPKGGLVEISGKLRDGDILIQVADNGIGITRENLEKVFDRFYQVDSSYTRAAGGVGLGLAIAKEIVVAHGGKIWAESEGLGKGAKLCFTLPLGG